jgi:hypothetical protein
MSFSLVATLEFNTTPEIARSVAELLCLFGPACPLKRLRQGRRLPSWMTKQSGARHLAAGDLRALHAGVRSGGRACGGFSRLFARRGNAGSIHRKPPYS